MKQKDKELKEDLKEVQSGEENIQPATEDEEKWALQQEEMRAKDDKIAEMEAKMEQMKKDSFIPEPTVMPKEQKALPQEMQDSQIKTTVKDMSSIIKERMMQLQDLATMEVLLDTHIRAKNRMTSIKKMASAEHIKVRGIWKTTAPKMHISNLVSKKLNADEYEISFGVYETDKKGNKRLYVQYAEVEMHDGSKIRRATSAQYRIAYEVIEKIRSGKPVTREVVRIDRIQE